MDDKSYLSAPKTSAETKIKGRNYIVESYYIGRKNIHDTLISIAKNSEEMRKNGAGKTQKKYCIQSGDNIYPEDGRFSMADSNVAYRLLLEAFAQANIRNPRATK